MKKFTTFLFAALLTCSLAACSNGGDGSAVTASSATADSSAAPDSSGMSDSPAADSSEQEAGAEGLQPLEGETAASAGEENSGSHMLVAYFSYAENADLPEGVDASSTASIQEWNGGLTGNTGVIAAMIGEITGADMFSIQTVEKYPDTYDATVDQGQEERNADTRPELATHVENLDDYDVIFLGFPNWWGDMPMAVYSFLDEVDLSGKTIVPFVTSGGSGFSNTISTIETLEPDAVVQEGLSVSGSSAVNARDQVTEWLNGLGY